MTEPNKKPPVQKVEEVAVTTELTVRDKARKTWESPTTQRFVRNTVKFGVLGTAFTAADEVLAWGQDKPNRRP